jgi:hypothetical protein
LRGRFELLLAEINDLELEHVVDTLKYSDEIQLGHDVQTPIDGGTDAFLCEEDRDAVRPQQCTAGSAADQSPAALDDCAAPIALMVGDAPVDWARAQRQSQQPSR